MSGKARPRSPGPHPPGPPPPAHAGRPAGNAQPARSFDPLAAKRNPAESRRLHLDELVATAGGQYQARDPERHVMNRPSGVYNFVRVEGETRNKAATYISSRAPHATLAHGRPVLYAGTAAFEAGRLSWWSNYSGTYQPIAEFNRQAALPTDKFVPWQQLQMGGVGLQRGMLNDHRRTAQPETKAGTPAPAAAGGEGKKAGPGMARNKAEAAPSAMPNNQAEPRK
ncbi:MAG: hypothetical protein NVV74_20965 [Magnetospirillum sp.]|nr:hypothetical protein [Magnetospirillum sp.]